MKGLLGLLKQTTKERTGEDPPPSQMFTTAFGDLGVDSSRLVPWEARSVEIGARRLASERGISLLINLWSKDKYMSQLDSASIMRLEHYFHFASVPADRDIIRQDEYGNFMVVLLSGVIAVDRYQPWGEHLRLAESRPGEILGEMSLLDSGIRFSVCTSLTDCEIGVLNVEAMDDMMTTDPRLAASMVALLARRLSLRLRAVSARLSDRPA